MSDVERLCEVCKEDWTLNDPPVCRECTLDRMLKRTECEHCGKHIWNDNALYLGVKPRDHLETCPMFCALCDSRGCLVCATKRDAVKVPAERKERE